MLTGLFAFFLDHSRNAWTGARESMRLFGGRNPPNGAAYSLQTQLGPTSPIGPRVSQPGQWANQTWRWCDFNASSYLNRYLPVLSVFVFVFFLYSYKRTSWPTHPTSSKAWPTWVACVREFSCPKSFSPVLQTTLPCVSIHYSPKHRVIFCRIAPFSNGENVLFQTLPHLPSLWL